MNIKNYLPYINLCLIILFGCQAQGWFSSSEPLPAKETTLVSQENKTESSEGTAVTPTQTAEQENNSLKSELDALNEQVKTLNSKVSELDNTAIQQLRDELSSKIDKIAANQPQHLSKENVNWMINSIKKLQNVSSINKKITHFENEIRDIQNRKCYSPDCIQQRDADLENTRYRLLELQDSLGK